MEPLSLKVERGAGKRDWLRHICSLALLASFLTMVASKTPIPDGSVGLEDGS